MGLLDLGLKKADRELIERLINLAETLVDGKEIVIKISLERKRFKSS